VFLLSLFGANMTAFSILGASGHAFANGIVTYGLMASSSALIIPVALFVIGTRLWALGQRHGFMTPVQMFRDRWECGHIGTVIFAVQAVLLIPYICRGMGGGRRSRLSATAVSRSGSAARSCRWWSWATSASAACAARRS
jgi:SSS family solute:Na+ symporter